MGKKKSKKRATKKKVAKKKSSKKKSTAKRAKKKGKKKRRGGRPRVRSGDEVQVSIEFPLVEYAQLSAYTVFAKERAAAEGGSVWRQSQRYLFLRLWREFWESLSLSERRKIERSQAYKDSIG